MLEISCENEIFLLFADSYCNLLANELLFFWQIQILQNLQKKLLILAIFTVRSSFYYTQWLISIMSSFIAAFMCSCMLAAGWCIIPYVVSVAVLPFRWIFLCFIIFLL